MNQIRTMAYGLILCGFIMQARNGWSQEAPDAKKEEAIKTHNVGAAGGFLSGNGLSYRRWLPSMHGFQLTFVPIVLYEEDMLDVNTSAGALGLRSFHRTRRTNFFGYYGAHYKFRYDEESGTRFSPLGREGEPFERNTTNHTLFVGAGVGVEIHFWNLNYSLMFGLAAKNELDKPDGDFPGESPENAGEWNHSFESKPSVESALYYSF